MANKFWPYAGGVILLLLVVSALLAPVLAPCDPLRQDLDNDLLAYSVAKMKEHGIVDSGDSLKNGIGAMSDERYTSFFNKMVKAGVVKADLDFRKSYTLRFVNKGVGVELRPNKP